MIIAGSELKVLLDKGLRHFPSSDIRDHLVVTPLLDPEVQVDTRSSGIDIRLGTQFRVHKKSKVPSYDPLSQESESSKTHLIDSYYIPFGKYFVLHPNQFILGITLEWIHLPKGLAGYVIGRSSWGRQGLIIATATGVHPGFSGSLVLELFNAGEVPVHLYPGVRIAQLFIHSVKQAEGVSEVLDKSDYVGQTKPESHPPISIGEKKIINYLETD